MTFEELEQFTHETRGLKNRLEEVERNLKELRSSDGPKTYLELGGRKKGCWVRRDLMEQMLEENASDLSESINRACSIIDPLQAPTDA